MKIRELEGDGDFRSQECRRHLEEADVVVTNPPFSLFREYVAQLMEYKKKFIIIGNQNAVIDKEIFPLIKNNQLWLGVNHIKEFIQPNKEIKKFGNICWYTNVENKRRNETLDLYKRYNEKDFPKYDNYDAIEVSKVCEIPMDYNKYMGVPITILEHYNPTQFEIIGISDRHNSSGLRTKVYTEKDMPKFNDYNKTPCLKFDNTYKSVYARILIRRK